MCRIEVYEKYRVKSANDNGYSEDWWRENMPAGSKPPEQVEKYAYRRTMPLIMEIERPIEIPNNKKECTLRFWSGEDMTILANYDEFCLKLHDLEEQIMIEREMIIEEMCNVQSRSNGD